MTNTANIPKGLAERPIWLAFRLEDRGGGRLSKPPVSPRTGRVCAKTDESEHVTLTEALVGAEHYDLDGVGVVLPEGIVCIDLDSAFTDEGVLREVAQDVYDHFPNAVWEYSPSGEGLHGYMYGAKPNKRTKDSINGIEVYEQPAFLTVTGDLVEGSATEMVDCQDELEWLYDKYLPPLVTPDAVVVVEHGDLSPEEWLSKGLSNDEKLRTLYNNTDHSGDESSADFALLSKLAYWLNGDAEAMREAFLASPWAKTKDASHTRKLKRVDYFDVSIEKAAAMTSASAYRASKAYQTRTTRFFTLTQGEDGEDEFSFEDYTDLGNSKAMLACFSDVLCYTPEWGWCFYDGTRWETDVSYRAMEAARDIANTLMDNAKAWLERTKEKCEREGLETSSDEYKARMAAPMALYKHAMKSQSEHGITAMVGLNKAFMVAKASQFDADPWLLNTPKGVVDLKSGELMPHDAQYRMTSMTSTAPDTMDTPMFDAFLNRIFMGDSELIEFMQVVVGSALVGKVYSENLIIANGTGANGKSTLFNTIHYLLGDYATAINPDLLMSWKASDQQVGAAMLVNKRFAVAQETEEGQRFSSSMLKRLVSTDTMVVKRLYKDPFETAPTHTLVLSTNHLPKVSSTDTGTWRRIVVVPFNATIPAEEMITDFHSLLMEREGAGILQWAVDGAVAFAKNGCMMPEKPKAVIEASSEYRTSEDWVAAFTTECCVEADAAAVLKHNDIYRVYRHWAKENGEFVRSSTAFGKALTSAGWHGKQKWFDAEKNTTTKVWFGWSLVDGGRTFNLVQGDKKERAAR